MSIEEILKLDKEITFWRLVYSKYKFKWGFIGISFLILGVSLILYWLFWNFVIMKIWIFIIGLFFMIISCLYLLNKNTKIIKKNYKHDLLENGSWNYVSILKIRKRIIRKKMKGNVKLTNENLLFIIESLKKESENKKYNYSILVNTIIIISSVCIGGFLGGFGNYTKDMNDYLEIYKLMVGISLIIIIVICYAELIIFKEFIISMKRKNYRLIRVFENIYIEKNAT